LAALVTCLVSIAFTVLRISAVTLDTTYVTHDRDAGDVNTDGVHDVVCVSEDQNVIRAPQTQGMSQERLDALKDELAKRNTRAFLVIRNDKIVYEWYADGNDVSKKQGTASLAKAIVAGLSLGVAITDGQIALDDPAAKYVPAWKDDPQKSRITIRHLGSHTSGLEDAEADRLPHDKLTGWKGDFWKRLDPPHDPFTLARDKAGVLFEPGSQLQYSNPGIGMLTYCVTAAIHDAEATDVRTLLRDRILRPIGVADDEWSVETR
jgi:CubicO group peptidase (beta-lactamase class C family)